METFNKLTKLVHSIPKLHEAGYKKGKEEGYKSGYDKGKDDGIAIGTSAFDQPLHIVENGEYISPSGMRYNPITVNVPGEVYEDVPLTITKNGVHEAPPKTRYTPITVDMPKPTLNAPEIYASAGTGNLIVNDFVNGIFTSEYLLYVDGVERATYTEKAIPMQEYIVTGEEQLQVKCKNDTFFNESELSNATTWNFFINGTPGLTYKGNYFTGIGTATDTTIYVASIVANTRIVAVDSYALKDKSNYTVILPDTIVRFEGQALNGCSNSTIIFGQYFDSFPNESIGGSSDMILDFSKATKIPTLYAYAIRNSVPKKIIVPDELYDSWVVATNWGSYARVTIRTSEWIVQGGAV